jgi:hypothetical protein
MDSTVYTALSQLGTHEAYDAQRVLAYYACTKLPSDLWVPTKTPWCAAFVCWVLEQSGIPHPHSARARDFASWGRACESKLGAIVVLSRVVHGGDPAPSPRSGPWPMPSQQPPHNGLGHVGFLLSANVRGHVFVLGGNQDNSVCVKAYESRHVLAVREPIPKDLVF